MLPVRLKSVQWLSTGGLLNLAYREWGPENHPHVLLCVHGLTRVSEDFDTLAQVLGQHMRVVAVDVPGRGRSDWLPDASQYQIPTYVAAMIPLLARLNAQTLDWLGTSMGGLIGMGVASLKGNPIRRLVINDVGPALNFEALQRISQYVGQTKVFPDFKTARDYIKGISLPFGPHTEAQWDLLARYVLVPCEGGYKPHYDPAIAQAFQAMTQETARMSEAMLWAAYDAITADTLILRGAESDLLREDTVQLMQTRGPKAKRVDFTGVGHAPTLMQADQIQVVADFILGESI